MKLFRPKQILVAALFLSLLSYFSCKRDIRIERRARFIDTLHLTVEGRDQLFVANSKGTNQFYLIQKTRDNTAYVMTRTDEEMDEQYTRIINLGSTSLIEVKGSRITNDFFTLSASDNYETHNFAPVNAYVYSVPNSDSLNICGGINSIQNYHYTSEFVPRSYISGNNYSQLKKFNSEGEEKWSVNLDGNYINGNRAIETDLEGNIYAITQTRLSFDTKPHPTLGTLTPYYYFPDTSLIQLYKYNSDGVLLFKLNVGKLYMEERSFNGIKIAITKRAIMIGNSNGLKTYDLNGNYIAYNIPGKNLCYNRVRSIISSPECENAFVMGEIRYTPNNFNIYYCSTNGQSSNVLSENRSSFYLFREMDNFENCYSGYQNHLVKISATGQELYNKNLSVGKYSGYIGSCVIDKFNSLYSFLSNGKEIFVYKFDEAGNYY